MSSIQEINHYLSMPEVARFLGYEPDARGFIRSPFHTEKTASCKLYREPGKGFYDFSSGTGGDCIKFVSLTQGVDSWTACKMLVDAFHLPVDLHSGNLTKAKVQELQRQRERAERAKKVEKSRTVTKMDTLKTIIQTCEDILESPHIQPLSDLWCSAVEQRNMAIIKVNEAVGIETRKEDLRLPGRHERQVS